MRQVVHVCLLILSLIFGAGLGFADTGFRLDYVYPNQGDDWYGSSGAPDARRDFPPLDLDQAYNGSDYEIGYSREMDPFGLGPPLDLTNTRHSLYEFRFGNQAFYGYECFEDGDCGTGNWCVGAPSCERNHCQPGGSRSCGDGNDCTVDTCNASLQQCEHSWVQPPGRVTNLMLSRAAPGSMVATLTWDDRNDEEWYNVYRGENPWLDDLACYEPGIVGTSVDDDGSVGLTGMYVLLVTADHHCGEGQLGVSSDFQLRFNHNPCP